MQVMRIRQRDDRYRNKKKKKQQHGSSHHHQAKQLNAEPAYRRKPNPIRRYDTDVLRSPSQTDWSEALMLWWKWATTVAPRRLSLEQRCLLCGPDHFSTSQRFDQGGTRRYNH
ncbi:hypothetical protein GOODEAATRI_002533 [Goodea atripinnis]|uniref:Uncharacterized protein n=1 Tax=Goodea atripinnis TaxID=208336 RepID=A0ABV0MES7_9TELE